MAPGNASVATRPGNISIGTSFVVGSSKNVNGWMNGMNSSPQKSDCSRANGLKSNTGANRRMSLLSIP